MKLDILYNKSSELMKEIPDKSVDLMVTSPPYNIGISYGNKWEDRKIVSSKGAKYEDSMSEDSMSEPSEEPTSEEPSAPVAAVEGPKTIGNWKDSAKSIMSITWKAPAASAGLTGYKVEIRVNRGEWEVKSEVPADQLSVA